jgi:hypothetical protein
MDNDNGKVYHVRLNSYERKVLSAMKIKFGASGAGAIRACIRSAAVHLGLAEPLFPTDSEGS